MSHRIHFRAQVRNERLGFVKQDLFYLYKDGVPLVRPVSREGRNTDYAAYFQAATAGWQPIADRIDAEQERLYGHWRDPWVKLGVNNWWIAAAWDPPFDVNSIYFCESAEELVTLLLHGNWSLGSAFAYQDQCWINQVDGGDEWLLIKGNWPFESVTACAVAGYDYRRDDCFYIAGHSRPNRLFRAIVNLAQTTEEAVRDGYHPFPTRETA